MLSVKPINLSSLFFENELFFIFHAIRNNVYISIQPPEVKLRVTTLFQHKKRGFFSRGDPMERNLFFLIII